MIIYQFQNAYRYNTDSLVLYHFLKNNITKNPKKAMDVGSGSGVLSLLLARDFKTCVDCVDISLENVFLTSYNFYKNNFLSKQVTFHRFLLGDFKDLDFDSYAFNGLKEIEKTKIDKQELYQQYDLIVSNPPFYNSNCNASNNHQNHSKNADFLPMEILFKNVYKLLKPKGDFMFCYESVCFDDIVYLLVANKFSIEKIQFFSATKDKNARFVCIKARKCIKTQNHILKTFSYDDKEFMNEVYNTVNVFSENIKYSMDFVRSLIDKS